MAFTTYPGSAGRVRYGVGDTVVASLKSWKIQKQVGNLNVTTFESGVDSNSVIHSTFISDNIAETTCEVEGFIDYDTTTTEAIFPIGTAITLDLLGAKTGPKGWLNIPAIVKSVNFSVELKSPQTFTATFFLTGVAPVQS